MPEVLSRLIVIYNMLTEVAETYPEAATAIDRALNDINLAARIIEGSQDLTACEDCDCTVEDGECDCNPVTPWPSQVSEVCECWSDDDCNGACKP